MFIYQPMISTLNIVRSGLYSCRVYGLLIKPIIFTPSPPADHLAIIKAGVTFNLTLYSEVQLVINKMITKVTKEIVDISIRFEHNIKNYYD